MVNFWESFGIFIIRRYFCAVIKPWSLFVFRFWGYSTSALSIISFTQSRINYGKLWKLIQIQRRIRGHAVVLESYFDQIWKIERYDMIRICNILCAYIQVLFCGFCGSSTSHPTFLIKISFIILFWVFGVSFFQLYMSCCFVGKILIFLLTLFWQFELFHLDLFILDPSSNTGA